MTPFERIGGAPVVHALAAGFYDAIEEDDRFAELRAMHGDMTEIRAAFAAWLGAWLGGPPLPADPRGCIMSHHRALAFGPRPAEQWLAAMDIALAEHVADEDLRSALREAFTRMAAAMISQPG